MDPLVVLEEKYAPLFAEKLEAREVLAKELSSVAESFSSGLATLIAEYEAAKAAGELEQQVALGSKIDQLQVGE